MKKSLIIIIFLFIFLLPINVKALNSNYNDSIAKIVNVKQDENKINIYLFYGDSCPHCHSEIEALKQIEKKYKNKVNIYKFETFQNEDNKKMMENIKEMYKVTSSGVPFTIIGEEYFLGYSETQKNRIEAVLDDYLLDNKKENNNYTIPIIGKVDAKKASISLIAIILGFIDGFNPCALWILLLLINITIGLNSRKKMFILGTTFIFTSGIVYFFSMLGISLFLNLTTINFVRAIIGIVAIILGIYNLITYIKTWKQSGCHVVDKKKRKGIIKSINNIISKKSFILSIIGIVGLAVSVNLVELACSLGFPTIFLEILAINNIKGIVKIIYLILYILFYLLDDLIIFNLAVFTLSSKGISTKYNKLVNLIGGIIMIIMGLLLIFKPSIIMLNF